MSITLAFDVYGTLINTHGIVEQLRTTVGERADAFSKAWREKQLEYSFRRGLMQNYAPFSVCTAQALDFTARLFDIVLSPIEKEALLDAYRTLPAFDDVQESLRRLQNEGHRLFAFSNGSHDAVETLLAAAGIREFFSGVVSVDDLKTFKPSPAVYSHFLREAQATGDMAWLISSNPFDVIGALSAGMRAAWVKRSEEALFDPWGMEPTQTITRLTELKVK